MTDVPTAAETNRIWIELAQKQHGDEPGRLTRRVLVGELYDCYLAVDFPDRRRMLMVVAHDGDRFTGRTRQVLTSGIEMLLANETSSGHPRIDLVLVEASHADIFTALVADLLDVLRRADGATSDTGLGLVVSRIRRWQQLLASVRPEGISIHAQRGLFGELFVMNQLMPEAGASAVTAWSGPDPGCQDFQFPRTAIEVKTTSPGHPFVVEIHGERQLEDVGGFPLHLVTLVLDARRGGAGQTLPDLVDAVHAEAERLGVTEDFDQRLAKVGYLPTQSHLYAEPHYMVPRLYIHRVGAGFPRIVPADLPQGVTKVAYTLDLLAANDFEIQDTGIAGLLGETR